MKDVEKEEFFEEEKGKKKKEKNEKSLFSRIMNVILWIILFAWMIIVVIDFVHVRNEEEPQFCWGEKVTKYDDGTVTERTGLGYKVISYNRESLKAIEFGPFWISDRTAEDNK